MIVFHTDLDSTLIYTERHNIGDKKVCVEHLNNKPFCYMTPASFDLLSKLRAKSNVEIVPLTARTEGQFKRVQVGNFKYALVTNGGILLRDGIVDSDWYKESLEIVSKSGYSLNKCKCILENDVNRTYDVTFVDNLYLYTKSSNPSETVELIKRNMDCTDLIISTHRSKVYVFPRGMDKGTAIERFKKVIDRDTTLFADDALYNIPTNDSVDLFLTSDESVKQIGYTKSKYVSGIFSDNLLSFVDEVSNNEVAC